ncbi:1102_t:CDS:2 [Entrophospora sp. SA101]|nr:1102_t:CDS:2 [Entrophospora sp. SA101]
MSYDIESSFSNSASCLNSFNNQRPNKTENGWECIVTKENGNPCEEIKEIKQVNTCV